VRYEEGYTDMKKSLQILSVLVALAITLAGVACTPVDTANTNSPAAAPPTNTARPASASAKPTNVGFTWPVLDAFLADQAITNDLRSRLQLTDDQINRLKAKAREETGKLRESDDDTNYAGTTAAARTQAAEQIKEILGEEKANQLAAFVSERWGGGDVTASGLPATPGAVPTDTRVVVNAPAFRMDVFKDGQLIKTYRIGIGYPEFPLPSGLRRADTIIFNPSWTPPDEPWVEAPDSKVKVGETVKPGDKRNPLGPIKIPIGLPSLIHGGKAPAKLGTFASHGCVGLTSPQVQEFARLLAQVSGTQLSDTQLASYESNKTETREAKLAAPVPVELRYETITVEDGKLHIYRDVYDRDTNTEENLRAVLQAYGVSLDQLSEAERSQALEALSQMSRDPSGRPDTSQAGQPNANANSNSPRKDAAANKNSAKVTRTIKGQKEVVIEVAALKGKGYPAPVDPNTGGAKEDVAATGSQKKPASGGRRR
jgi:lipoprotein-anchoring transpeptidase ErfK/SrfK